ncbi:hypothetical protein V8B97DRAFT_1915952 [Scleroderma yunnanense]
MRRVEIRNVCTRPGPPPAWPDSIVTSGSRKEILLRHHGPSYGRDLAFKGDDDNDGGYLLTMGTAMRMFEIFKLQVFELDVYEDGHSQLQCRRRSSELSHSNRSRFQFSLRQVSPPVYPFADQKTQGRKLVKVGSSLNTMPPPRRVIHRLNSWGLGQGTLCKHNSESTSQVRYGLDGKSETVNSFATPRKFPVYDELADSSKPYASKQEICMCLRRNNPSIRLE